MVGQLFIAAMVSLAGAGFGLVAGRLLTRGARTPAPEAVAEPPATRVLESVLAPYNAPALAGQ